MLDALAPEVAVLGTTATANDRVVADVVAQLMARPPTPAHPADDREPLRTYRGPLARSSLRLEVLELPRPAERLAWLAANLPQLPGLGNRLHADQARRRAGRGVAVRARGSARSPYSGEHETEDRIATEDRLLRNEIKAVVATSALGMGYDKSDLSFVVHYQAPGSVISYYQQIGRAGRGVEHADIVLLRGGEDRRIQDFFIEQAFPDRERVTAVLGDLETAGDAGRTTRELMAVVNLGMGRIEAMLKILDVEGAVARAGSRWMLVPDADWSYDAERYAQVTALRRAEQRAMAAFGSDGRCLMRVLQEQLDDPAPADCGRCSVCAGPRFAAPLDPALVEAAGRHLRSTPIELEVKKMAPDASGRRCARSPRTPASSRAGRSRGSATADGGRRSSAACAPASSRTTWWPRSPTSCRSRRGRLAHIRAVRPARRRARAPGATASACRCPSALVERGRRPPAPARDGQRRPAGRQRPRRLPGRARRRRPAIGRRCSTTAASRAGRSRWSAVSSAAPARSGWCRWRSPLCSSVSALRTARIASHPQSKKEERCVASSLPCAWCAGSRPRRHGGVASATGRPRRPTVPLVVVKARSGGTAALVPRCSSTAAFPFLVDTGSDGVADQTARPPAGCT